MPEFVLSGRGGQLLEIFGEGGVLAAQQVFIKQDELRGLALQRIAGLGDLLAQ